MPDKRRITDTGKYPVFSGYRIVGYYDECNLDGEELVVVARGVGGTGDVKLSPGACFLTNLSIAVVIDETVALKKFLYYYFHNHNLRYLDSGSAQSQITVSDLKNVEVPVPPLETQEKIVSTLEMLDYKIELNQKINENLERQAEAIFKGWFTDGKETNGCLADICQYSKEKVTVSSLDLDSYYSTENMLPEKAGATQAANLPTTMQTTKCNAGDVLVSNIRPYFKKIVYCYADCGCSTDVLCFVPKEKKLSAYSFFLLYADSFFDFMVAGSKGTKMPRGDKQQIMMYPVYMPSDEELSEFNSIA